MWEQHSRMPPPSSAPQGPVAVLQSVTSRHVVLQGAASRVIALGAGAEPALAVGPRAAPGDGVDTLAPKGAVGHALLLLFLVLQPRAWHHWHAPHRQHFWAMLCLTSMCSPSHQPLCEKLEQPSSSSVPAQRATAVACQVGTERADQTERHSSSLSAMG